jgi:tocopherol cyclase
MNLRIYNSEVFQGTLSNTDYFEGWYFKHVSSDLEHVYSFIPGVSLTRRNSHAFIQVINGITGKTVYITYPLNQFIWDKKSLFLKVGGSVFTEKYVDLKIEDEKLKVSGRIEYNGIIKYPKRLLSPGIMGWYSFIPFMECKHGIVSVNHFLSGSLLVKGASISFDGGKGYIEKDWGTSFPEAWIWTQANNFNDRNTSFNFSIAKIPWLGKFFIGFIAFLYYNNEFFLFSTYNNSVITELLHSDQSIRITLKNRNAILKVVAVKNTFGELIAPVSGDMSRRIKESVDSEVRVELFDKYDNLLYADSSRRAGLEVIEKIFDYLSFKNVQESQR